MQHEEGNYSELKTKLRESWHRSEWSFDKLNDTYSSLCSVLGLVMVNDGTAGAGVMLLWLLVPSEEESSSWLK